MDTTVPTNDSASNPTPMTHPAHPSVIDETIDRYQQMIQAYWDDNPDLYRAVQLKKKQKSHEENLTSTAAADISAFENQEDQPEAPFSLGNLNQRAQLRATIRHHQHEIRQRVLANHADIIPRTQAHNRKSSHETVEEETEDRATLLKAQINAWRPLLGPLIRRFSKLPDYRRATSVKHKMTVLMIFGLFSFIFRLNSRREMNRELTGPMIFSNLKKVFPEIDSIPHADTLARALENLDPKKIESIHINMIKDLIRNKKFKCMLIEGCLPITIDGGQKLYRQGLLQDERWCERKVGDSESQSMQQYIYVLEANLTLKNGLTIPLMSEYLYRSHNELEQDEGKQDCETTAFERLTERLKAYFPRLKIMVFADSMFATQPSMAILHQSHWEYLIRLPKKKLTDFAKILNANRDDRAPLPDQTHFRKRKQSFYWENHIPHGYENDLEVNLIACFEEWEEVNKKTGEIEPCYSEHAWISSIPATLTNLHELCNLGARKKELIEDSFNTEKNRGYHYNHAFSYDWNAMQGFHYLMRLGHAINAISEFSKTLKKYVKLLGCSATLKLIKDTLFNPWLPAQWYEEQMLETPQLRLQLE